MGTKTITPIAYISTDYKEKFGIPRQSGRAEHAISKIIFTPEYRNPTALTEIKGFSHLWLLFDFSKCEYKKFSPTVRPPRLGGNKRVGVFASRSPFRPNGIGLSNVKLIDVVHTEKDGDILIVSGADLLDGTPIYDIKPYLPSADCIVDAKGGYAEEFYDYKLTVHISDDLLNLVPADKLDALIECLSDDPRPSYQADGKEYGMKFATMNVKFTVSGDLLTVTAIDKIE